MDGYTTFKYKDKVISNCLSFNKYESKILYPSNEPVSELIDKTNKNSILKLGKTFKVEGSPLNYLTLDKLSFIIPPRQSRQARFSHSTDRIQSTVRFCLSAGQR